MKTLKDIKIDNKRVLIRVDYNVPIQNDIILDLNRIEASMPTIQYYLKQKQNIVLMSHFGRPDGVDPNYSLEIIKESLSNLLNQEILFCSDISCYLFNICLHKCIVGCNVLFA